MTRSPARTPFPDDPGDVARRRRGRVRAVVLGRHVVLLNSLDIVLTREGYDVRCVATCAPADPLTAAAAAIAMRPRVVVLSTALSTDDAFRVLPRLVGSGARVVVLDDTRAPAQWGDHLRSGASAVVGLHEPMSRLLEVLDRLSRGLPATEPATGDALVAASLAQTQRTGHELARLRLLTPRERAVLDLLADGLTVREIASREVVALGTVRTQVKAILAKLEVSSQLAAVAVLRRVAEAVGDDDVGRLHSAAHSGVHRGSDGRSRGGPQALSG